MISVSPKSEAASAACFYQGPNSILLLSERALAVGAPFLFSLSTILVETLTGILSSIPEVSETTTMNMPFSFSTVGMSINFIVYFSVIFLIVNNLLASRILGLVAKGDEKYGIKYLPPMIVVSIAVFFAIRILLSGYVSGFIAP